MINICRHPLVSASSNKTLILNQGFPLQASCNKVFVDPLVIRRDYVSCSSSQQIDD